MEFNGVYDRLTATKNKQRQCLLKLKKSAGTSKVVNSSRCTDRLIIVTIVPRSDTFIISAPSSFLTVPYVLLMLVLL